MNADPRRGDVVIVDGRASVQFAAHPFTFRVVRTHRLGSTPTGWIWLTGYVLNTAGNATEHRELFVQVAGLRQPIRQAASHAPTRNGGPTIPRQRTRDTTTTTARSLR